MNTQAEKYRSVTYHVYLNLHGPDGMYKPVYEYLEKIGAQSLGRDYPTLWYFRGNSEEHEKYQQELFSIVNASVPQNILDHPEVAWRVLLMHPGGHNGCAGGFLPSRSGTS